MTESNDSVLRSMTNDGGFRVIVASTTDTVQEIVDAQGATGGSILQVANLMTGTILVRETMAPQYRVQGIVRGAGNQGSIVVDAHPDGANRGLLSLPEGAPQIALGEGATLQIMRTLMNGQIHQGLVSFDGVRTLSEGLMKYMQISEQVTSVIDVACLVEHERVVAAGGYLVQLLPDVAEGMLAIMTERLHLFDPVETLLRKGKLSPRELSAELLYGMPHGEMGSSPLRFGCNCSHMRIVASLSTLSRGEIEELYKSGETLEISCDFCGKDYHVSPDQLRGLLASN